jgi:23S rRNA (cytidine1920-2'-O)/16S rRNA (cytidine1409-2'-O)-methyltransferase
MTRRRADVVLAERGYYPSREKARAAILAGEVRVDGEIIDKAGTLIDEQARVDVAEGPRYVSRGGLKLAGALGTFGISVTGMRAVDVGASTGGFTDCLLQAGAAEVTAVDVGYGQLAWSLRQDDRVRVFERTNIRNAEPKSLGAPFDLAVVDVSFIGLRVVLPRLKELLGETGTLLALVKPQFEAGKGRVGKRGVVRDAVVHEEVLCDVLSELERANLIVHGLTWSPLKGPQGNIEFWVWADKRGSAMRVDPAGTVREAHESLGV